MPTQNTLGLKDLLNIKIFLVVLIISVISEFIGIQRFDTFIGALLLLPLLYAFVLALLFNRNVIAASGAIFSAKENSVASPWILIALLPFIAKFSVGIGPHIPELIAAGPALILQEFGNVATVFFALPVAVFIFNMGRETIGATHSIAREPNIALIADRYGLKGPEGIGVMGVYVIGTVLGAIYFSLLAGIIASWNVFDIRALAMACGVGSGSMMGACATTLAEIIPDSAEQVKAFSASSNLLTYATGLFVSAFIALPLAEVLYKVSRKLKGTKTATLSNSHAENIEISDHEEEIPLSISIQTVCLFAIGVLCLLINWFSLGNTPTESVIGMLFLILFSVLGLIIRKFINIGVPAVAWVSVVAIIGGIPQLPFGEYVLATTDKIGMLLLITPVLAFAGLAISQSEITLFKKSGFKIIIIALLIFTGTFIGSALIAQALL